MLRAFIQAFTLLCSAHLAVASPAATETPKQWTMKYLGGPIRAEMENQEVSLQLEPESIRCIIKKPSFKSSGLVLMKAKPQGEFLIPLSGITQVIYSPTRFPRSRQVSSGMPSPGGAYSAEGAGAYALLWAAAMAFSSGIHGISHFVSIVWEQEGVHRELFIEAKKGDASEFVSRLQKLTPKQVTNLETQWNLARAELDRNKDKKVQITLDRAARVDDWNLAPGVYHAIYLESGAAEGALYLFSNADLNSKKLVAITSAKMTNIGCEAHIRPVEYDAQTSISGICLSQGKMLHLEK